MWRDEERNKRTLTLLSCALLYTRYLAFSAATFLVQLNRLHEEGCYGLDSIH